MMIDFRIEMVVHSWFNGRMFDGLVLPLYSFRKLPVTVLTAWQSPSSHLICQSHIIDMSLLS